MYVVLAILLAGVGLLMLLAPRLFLALTEGWKSNGEPSDAYLRSTRFGGAVFLLVGAGGALVLLFFV